MPGFFCNHFKQEPSAWAVSSSPKNWKPQRHPQASDNEYMNDDVKLVTAFLALNAGVIALAFAGYLKGSMNIGAVLQHLAQ